MGHTHIKTIETSILCDHNTVKYQYRADPVFIWMFLHTYTKNVSKSDKNGNFITWPGLRNQQLFRHLPPIIVTALGHLDQEHRNLLSTNPVR